MAAYENVRWIPPDDAVKVFVPRDHLGKVPYAEMRDWLTGHGDGLYRIRALHRSNRIKVCFVFSDPDTAFAFKLRWL